MKRYRRGKNRCKVCGWPLNDGNSHLHLMEKRWVKMLYQAITQPSKFLKFQEKKSV